jgi:putative pyruvate formate lyase activating enzyme
MNELEKIKKLYRLMSPCYLCPLNCGAERLKGQRGVCNSNVVARVSSYILYKGEEPPVSGQNGSGAIFFSNCNLKCVYCQNYNFSQLGSGENVSISELSEIMMKLQSMKASNINLITATHFLPQSMAALRIAIQKGLNLPIVWNTSGYESVEILKLLEGFIDVYLPDFRYATDEEGVKYSGVPFMTVFTVSAIKEMLRQVGEVRFDSKGIIKKGVIMRILVFPNGSENLRKILRIIKSEFSADVYISLMSQYVPVYLAKNFTEINRKLTKSEISEAIKLLREEGFKNGWVQYD